MVQIERSNQFGTLVCCVPCYWLRRSKSVHKALLTFAMLLVTSLLVTSPVLFLISTLPEAEQTHLCTPLDGPCTEEEGRQEGVCDSSACHQASRRMLSSMQRNIDPCKDFYQFACGRFQNEDSYESISSFNLLQKQVDGQIESILMNETGKMGDDFIKLNSFYKSCLNFKEKPVDFAPVYRLLNRLGGYIWPDNEGPADITPLISSLLKISGASLLNLYADADLFDHSRMAIFVDLPKNYQSNMFVNDIPILPKYRRELYKLMKSRHTNISNLDESRAFTIIKNSKDETRSHIIQKIIQGFIPTNMEPTERSSEANRLLQFCLALNKIYPRPKDIYKWINVDKRIYIPYNLTYLQESFDYIRWGILLNSILYNSTVNLYKHNSYEEFNKNNQHTYIYVTAPHYFHSLGKLLNRFSNRMIHNGLLVLYATDVLHDIVNVTASKNWSENCIKLTKNIFSDAVGMIYVQQYNTNFLELLINRVSLLFESIKETLAERILIMPWLDEKTRTQAVFRLHSLRGKFEIWPGYFNKTSLMQEMTEVQIDYEDFLSTVIRRFEQIRTLEGQIKRNATQKWYHPFGVNAYYDASSHSIVIPLAMMIALSWSWNGGPTYVVYATLGSVISHEMLHAFDLHHQHLPHDLSNDQWSWITPEAWHRLEIMIECVAKLYARSFWKKVKFFGNSVDIQFDWNLTRSENIADIGALQIAYQTWYILTKEKDQTLPGLENLRPSQLFFISAAQNYCLNMTSEAYILSVELDYHTPQPERINGIMMNSPEFAEAFRCNTGTRMNPSKKCKTW